MKEHENLEMKAEMLDMLNKLAEAALKVSDEVYDDDWERGTAGILKACDLLIGKIEQYAEDPAGTLPRSDMKEYGYKWDGMIPLSKKAALRLSSSHFPVYLLYQDDTESEAENEDQINQFDGFFGIEETSWLNRGNHFAKSSLDDSDKKYLVMETKTCINGKKNQTEPVHASGCDVFDNAAAAMRNMEKRKRNYIKNYGCKFLTEESSKSEFVFSFSNYIDGIEYVGKFVISMKEIAVSQTYSDVEIKELFASVVDDGMDELDFYMDLLDRGITVNMVRSSVGEDAASHMKQFCEEHGLLDEGEKEEHYTPSSTEGDYGPSNPWDAPGMSIHDFI